jgi:hypothetical protein
MQIRSLHIVGKVRYEHMLIPSEGSYAYLPSRAIFSMLLIDMWPILENYYSASSSGINWKNSQPWSAAESLSMIRELYNVHCKEY